MKCFQHQLDAAKFILERKGIGAIYHEMGLGKTRTALEIFSYLKTNVIPDLKLLVVAPLSLLEAAWGEDIKRFHPELKHYNIHDEGLPTQNWQFLKFPIYVVNYESFILERNLKGIVNMVSGQNWMLVCDESSKMKNHQARTTKAMLSIGKHFRFRIVMSGTPAPNSEAEYWAQMELLEPGILSKSFYQFRNTYFYLRRGGQVMPMQGAFVTRQMMREYFMKGFKYEMGNSSRERFMEKIRPLCHFARKKDCLDLPDQVDEVRLVEMGRDQRKIYNDMKRHLLMEINGKQIAARVALTKIMKLRQVTSGFSYDEAGETHAIKGATKLGELMEVIDQVGDQPLIIWIQFHWELNDVCHQLYRRFGENQVVTLYSGTKDRDGSIKAFQNGDARFLVAHPKSAAHGLTFVNCSTQIFYSLDWSWEAYEQARARIHRAGQTKKCTYVHILANDSIDQHILDMLRKKGSAEEILFKMKGKK